ncbi:hypothetical protein TWF679_001349 [Orbilia oligospora]|uniref:Uncharacterized protein n=1 Tax=Orbilia oligospora TaxID=2813651 RepID=A0A8H8UVN4_ORBOL|nr:hypothetical protein TWF679_001349 [Orbilia oligospora]
MPRPDVSPLTVLNATAWTSWLAKNAQKSSGVWLTLAKKGVTSPTSLTYSEALEEALCYGWIDGQRKSCDEKTFAQRFTPRTGKSGWSKRNVGIVEKLEREGRMKAGGVAAVVAAKADGRWERAYAGSATAVADPAFLEALEGNEVAKRAYEGLSSQNRFAIYWRLLQLKTEAGRTRKIREFVVMLENGGTIYPQNSRVVEEEDKDKDMDRQKEQGEGKGKAKRIATSESGDETTPSVQKRAKKGKAEASKVEVGTKVVEEKVEPRRRQGLRQRKEKP